MFFYPYSYVRPLARLLLPDAIGSVDDDAEFLAFTVHYSVGMNSSVHGTNRRTVLDQQLAEHRDASVATLNINLNLPGESFEGSGLYFVDSGDDSKRYGVHWG